MSSYADFLHNYRGFVGNPFLKYKQGVDWLYEHAHGGLKYFLSQLPITGRIRQFEDTIEQWEDSYNNTGTDPRYSTRYGSAGIPFLNEFANAAKPVRMAKSLMKMYGAEIELDIAKERFATARQYGHNAELWRSAWEERNKR